MQLLVITSPQSIKNEALLCNSLFAHGLEILHLRKPEADEDIYEKFIGEIEPRYRDRIVIHAHYHFVQKYGLRGLHFKSGQGKEYINHKNVSYISISCHSIEEIETLPFRPAYCFLSPLFDSISKEGYKSCFTSLPDVRLIPFPVIGLGGITPNQIPVCREQGFAGIAVLGYIWEQAEEALSRFIRLKTPEVMSIAGFDPSCGAGISADLKTFENCGSYGRGICSAITFQNEDEFSGIRWTSIGDIQSQCELQFRKSRPEYIKIGLIERFSQLQQLTEYLSAALPGVRMIWDPILKASAGFTFHGQSQSSEQLDIILSRIYLITPNTEELYHLFGNDVDCGQLQAISRKYQLNILWKGGHNQENLSTDRLITPDNIYSFPVHRSKYGKHGTGCVLSSALAAFLSQGIPLPEAAAKAQVYVSQFINSNDSKLGYHIIGHNTSHLPSPKDLKLQYITDHKEGLTTGEQIEAVCRGGIRWVQLRMKETPEAQLIEEGLLAREICRRYNALFIVNDNVCIARQLDADGVHLGKEDMEPLEARKLLGPGKIIGATCNSWEDVLLRTAQKVDYIGLGPFTFTTTKKKLSPVLGLTGYEDIIDKMHKAGIHIPVFAIGGIAEPDIVPLMKTGIQGIALSGLIKNANDLSFRTKEILSILNT